MFESVGLCKPSGRGAGLGPTSDSRERTQFVVQLAVMTFFYQRLGAVFANVSRGGSVATKPEWPIAGAYVRHLTVNSVDLGRDCFPLTMRVM